MSRLLRWLLAKRSVGFSLDSDDHPTLAATCCRGHAEIVQMLLAANISQSRKEVYYPRLPATIAAETNRWDIVKIFVDNLIRQRAGIPAVPANILPKNLNYMMIYLNWLQKLLKQMMR